MRVWLLILCITGLQASEIGEISELRGSGEITRQNTSDPLQASLASGIFSFDTVRTGNGRMAIEFLDSSVLKLTEQSRVVIDEFIYDPDPSKSRLALNMASGTARFITGKLGMINKENISIRTPSATIGIRGTDFTTTVDELGRSLIILLPDADGSSSGEITVTTAAGVEILNEPFQATMVTTFQQPPTKAVTLGNMTLELIDNMLIVNKPDKIEKAVAEQTDSSTTELDKDFFEENEIEKDCLEEDCEEEQEEVTRLDINLINTEFLIDLLASVDKKGKKASAMTLNNVDIEGLIVPYDPEYQVYTLVEDNILYFVHEGQNTYDIGIDTNAGTYLFINNAGMILEAEINGAGDNIIIINQSP